MLEEIAVAVAMASVVGCVLQLPYRCRPCCGGACALRAGDGAEQVRTVLRNFWPAVSARGVVQVSAYVDTIIASLLGAGALATLTYAQAISMLPVSLFGMSIAASELPAMSGRLGSEAEMAAALRERLASGGRRIAFFVIPSAVAFVALGGVLAERAVRGRGILRATMRSGSGPRSRARAWACWPARWADSIPRRPVALRDTARRCATRRSA
jgi:putative peptidoglycan lipid II flippase